MRSLRLRSTFDCRLFSDVIGNVLDYVWYMFYRKRDTSLCVWVSLKITVLSVVREQNDSDTEL